MEEFRLPHAEAGLGGLGLPGGTIDDNHSQGQLNSAFPGFRLAVVGWGREWFCAIGQTTPCSGLFV